jgi:type II secretory ATPase GspE/PulE/Tfp pilus assembly ATPase PilB-like protein
LAGGLPIEPPEHAMLDTPDTRSRNSAANTLPLPESATTISWPSPPLASYPAATSLTAPLACVVHSTRGRIARGQLMRLDFVDRVAEVIFATDKPPVHLRFEHFLSITLTQPLLPNPEQPHASKEAKPPLDLRPRTPYRLRLRDGKEMTGQTIGYLDKPVGLFLFPPIDTDDRVLRMFLPKEACVERELGKPIGQVLVEQNCASAEEVEQVAALQERLRTQKLGEILVDRKVVTPEELLQALEVQASMPVMRVGEALIAMGLIQAEQLDAVLAIQKIERSAPLGELLVREKMISREELNTALARKMGYPIVDLDQFPVETGALQRVPFAIAQRLRVLPLMVNENVLVVGLEDVTRRKALDELEFATQAKVVPALVAQEAIDRLLSAVYGRIGDGPVDAAGAGAGEPGMEWEPADVNKLAENLERDGVDQSGQVEEPVIEQSDNSLVRLINQMIAEACAEGASDIHIECSPGREKVKIRFRRDGQLRPYLELPHTYRNAVVSRVKVMCDLDISERRKPQDGKINFARFSPQHKVELRVVTIPTSNGLEDIVMRLLASARPIPLAELGLSLSNLARFRAIVERPYGLVLCVGPTGSGKTTTLHSALGHINRPECKIWTAEDPIEITQPGLRQVQVNPKIDVTFAKALRAFLRADPDVIMVGEARDEETAHIVVEASLTGHLVLSTLHTNSAPETVTRLLDMGVDTFNFADALLGVLAQRLVRRICEHCRTEQPATPAQIDELLNDYLHAIPTNGPRIGRDDVLADWHSRFARDGQLMHYESPGCGQCRGSGMRGRIGIHELMPNGRDLRRLIQARTTPIELQACAMHAGMRTLRQDGIEKVLQGLTTIEEVRATSNE